MNQQKNKREMTMDRSWMSRCLIMVLVVALLSGCGNARWATSMRRYNAATQTVAIDAKQRLVISGGPRAIEDTDGSTKRVLPVICAEPSPDALSALSSSIGISGSYKDKAQLASSFAAAEAAGSIGLRTQSIQLMRDAMYRLCEGYMAGAVDSLAFETLHRRFQSSMVTILAIEQLTGATRAQTIVLGGNTSVGDPKAVADFTAQKQQQKILLDQSTGKQATAQGDYDKKKAELDDLKQQQATLQAKNPAAGSPDEATLKVLNEKIATVSSEEKTLASTLDSAKTVTSDTKDMYDSVEAARLNALAGGGSAKASGQAYNDLHVKDLDPNAIESVATAVREMVRDTLQLPFQREFCASVLMAQDNPFSFVNSNSKTVSDYQDFATALKEANEAKANLNINTDSDKVDNLTNILVKKEAAFDTARAKVLKPTSTVESCLMYVNSSTMIDYTNAQSINFVAQAAMLKTQIALIRIQSLADKLNDRNLTPADKVLIENEMKQIQKTAENVVTPTGGVEPRVHAIVAPADFSAVEFRALEKRKENTR